MDDEQLVFRRALDADRAAVAAFCRAGNPNDYVPEVWDDWISEPGSSLVVGVLAGRPVAVAHVVVSSGEAWFEGLRIDPACRGRGFGRLMLEHSVAEARLLGATVLRLLTERANAAMHALLPQLGFRRCFEANWHVAPPLDGAPPAPLDLRVDELLAGLATAPLLGDTGGLYTPGWSFWTPGRDALAGHLRRGEVVGAAGIDGWAVVMDDGEDAEHFMVSLVAGDVPALLLALRAHPAAQAGGGLRAFVPAGGEQARLLEAAGFQPRLHHTFGIFAREL